jgi:arabinofuranosyltransferase
VIWAWSIGGDFMAYSRFLLPATVLAALAIGLSFARLDELLRERFATRTHLAIVGALALVPVIVLALRIPQRIAEDREHPHLHVDPDQRDSPGFEGVRAMDRFARVRLAAGARLRELVPPDTWISVGAAGALPYASALPAFDAYGLVDPSLLEHAEPATGPRTRPGHQLHASLDHVLAREPDLMCHIGWEAPRAPTLRDAQRRAGRGWAWACVETGPIADPLGESGTLESRWYCCLRPSDRFVELDPGRMGASR